MSLPQHTKGFKVEATPYDCVFTSFMLSEGQYHYW